MIYDEDDLLPISALQHLLFCERQAALIHVERVWADNHFTAEGNVLHKKAHSAAPETRDGIRITRSLPLRSFALGLTGQADVITFEPPNKSDFDPLVEPTEPLHGTHPTLAASIRRASPEELAHWKITPIEYKRGKPKKNDCDRVQLCAQALCLEEMLGVPVPRGELFYGTIRRRVPVEFDAVLRETTRTAALRLHEIIASGRTPPAVYEKKCDTCSLIQLCLPKLAARRSAASFLAESLKLNLTDP